MSNSEATALVEMLACPDSAQGAGTEPADDPITLAMEWDTGCPTWDAPGGKIIYGEMVA